MAHRHVNVAEAYAVLGLEQDATLEVVKSAYKQLALKTHPDKNPGDADATAQFQKVSQAYNTLVKHLDRSSAPSHTHTHSHYHPFGYDAGDYDDEDDYYYDEDEFYDDYDDDYEEMEFYRFLFEELLRGRASRFAQAQYHRHHHHHRPPSPPETPEQYAARLRKQVEEQEKAAERRARDEANRKENQERERQQERREAEQRQRAKASAKKASAEASRKNAEEKARVQQEQLQTLRSQIFAAARKQDAETVKKGIWEQNVDAAGGEIRKGSETFVKCQPTDPKETLMHIAAKNGDLDLVEWLDSHSADPEERNGEDMTAFHVALQGGRLKVLNHFLENYPPKGGDYADIYRSAKSKSNLRIALDTKEPEVVWLVLEKKLYTQEEKDAAWGIVKDKKFKSSISPADKYVEFVNLFANYGGYSLHDPAPEPESSPIIETAPLPTGSPQVNGRGPRQQNGKPPQRGHPHPTVQVDDSRSHTASPVSPASESPQTPTSTSSRGFRGHNRRGSFRPHQHFHGQQSSLSSSIDHGASHQDGVPGQQPSTGYRGRGRGRGQFHGRGRGRGSA